MAGASGLRYYHADGVDLLTGDAETVLRSVDGINVDCCVTSPPYFGLRDYGVDEQLGLENSPQEYVDRIVGVFRAVADVMSPTGTLWLNLGDSYASNGGAGGTMGTGLSNKHATAERPEARDPEKFGRWNKDYGVCDKNLLGIPWRVAFALQADGWILRNAVVWHKPNAMPSSVTDRLTNRYEMVFLFSRAARYYFDLDAIREPLAYPEARDGTRVFGGRNKGTQGGVGATERNRGHNVYGRTGMTPQTNSGPTGERHLNANDKGRNPGDMWSITTKPNPQAHFATFPIDLPLRCIQASCPEGGTVLDPFSGSGTTGVAARRLGHKYVGIDINPEYHKLAIDRLSQGQLAI